MINLIKDTASLEAFCAQLQNQPYITIDLEFIREKTYYAELALIQVGSEAECAIIDPLAPDLNMAKLFCFAGKSGNRQSLSRRPSGY